MIKGIMYNRKSPVETTACSNPSILPNLYEVSSPNSKLPATIPNCWNTDCKNDDNSGFLNSFTPKASVLMSWTDTHSVITKSRAAVGICFDSSSAIKDIKKITNEATVILITIQNFLLPYDKFVYFSIKGAKIVDKLPVINLKLKGRVAAEKYPKIV